MSMQDYFYALVDDLTAQLQPQEVLLCSYSGETTDFIRFNSAKIRQAGAVEQASVTLDLIEGQRHAAATTTLTSVREQDEKRLQSLCADLRELRRHTPEDPYLLYARDGQSTENLSVGTFSSADIVKQIIAAADNLDLVGILACGTIDYGFANSLGQRNWHSRRSFNFDWSVYLHSDKAVKARYAGFDWSGAEFQARMANAATQLERLARPVRRLDPGSYRVYLTPMALEEIVGLLSWGGFSLRAQRTGSSPLLGMLDGDRRLHDSITLTEHTAAGVAPDFQSAGFIRPAQLALIERGIYRQSLISPRSAVEYDLDCNGADASEAPKSLAMAGGALATEDALAELNDGLYIGNLWYLNYSDRNAARMTGMDTLRNVLGG